MAPSGSLANDGVTPQDHGDNVPVPGLPQEELEFQEKYRQETRLMRYSWVRRADVVEQASAIVFLASHDASYITGQVIPVGGGQPYPF